MDYAVVKTSIRHAQSAASEQARDSAIATALADNREISKLDWGAAEQNLYAMAKLTTAGGANDKEMAAQFVAIADNAALAPIGAFRLSAEAAQKSETGTAFHLAAAQKSIEYYDKLSVDEKHTVRRELQSAQKASPLPPVLETLVDGGHDARSVIAAATEAAQRSWAEKQIVREAAAETVVNHR